MKKISLGIISALLISILSGCTLNESSLLNTEQIDSQGIKKITLFYKSEEVTLFASDEKDVTIEEYLSSEKEKALVDQQDETLIIKSGKEKKWNFLLNSDNRVVVGIPKNYHGDLIIETGSGSIKLEDSFELNKVVTEQNSGNLKIGAITAADLSFKTGSGSIKGDILETDSLSAVSNSGNIKLDKVIGNADLETKSGNIEGSFAAVDKKVQAVSKSGNVKIDLSKNLNFDFEGETNSGSFTTEFEMELSGVDNVIRETIGNRNKKQVTIKTSSGNIELMKR